MTKQHFIEPGKCIVISLPAIDRCVSIGSYVEAIKLARSNPAREFKHGLTTWWPTTGNEIMRQFLCGVHDRINQAVPHVMCYGAVKRSKQQ